MFRPGKKELDGFSILAEYGDKRAPWSGKDWRHRSPGWMPVPQAKFKAAYGLVFQAQKHEFYFVGANIRFFLRPQLTPELSVLPLCSGIAFLRISRLSSA